jgi:polyisoprenoid-binding protein YceI
MTETVATRTVAGHVLPAAGTWNIDPGHAELAFIGRHFMVTKVRGRFTGVTGVVTVADDMAASSVEVTIDMRSVDSGSQVRDDHLRSDELFDVEKYPTALFRSTHVEWRGTQGTVHGDLTIHGVTQQVALAVSFEGQVRDPWGADRAMFSARAKVNREDFGITWNVALEAGGVLVSKEIQIEIELETVPRIGGFRLRTQEDPRAGLRLEERRLRRHHLARVRHLRERLGRRRSEGEQGALVHVTPLDELVGRRRSRNRLDHTRRHPVEDPALEDRHVEPGDAVPTCAPVAHVEPPAPDVQSERPGPRRHGAGDLMDVEVLGQQADERPWFNRSGHPAVERRQP